MAPIRTQHFDPLRPNDQQELMTPPPAQTQHLRPIIISGPSGTGKSTILKRLFADYPDKFGFSVSRSSFFTTNGGPITPLPLDFQKPALNTSLDTTRSPRAGEVDGRDYNFLTQEAFSSLVASKGFVEHATFGGNSYGTSIKAIEDIAAQGRTCILDIEMEGVKQIKAHPTFKETARFLFLSPPSLEVLEKRLRGRQTDKEEAILKRLAQAKNEMEFSKTGVHDKIVVNDDLDKAYEEVRDWILQG